MKAPTLWDRVRRARIVQVLLVYLGASWGVLQIADTLTEALSLPEWVSPVAIILLLVGLVIILATAWVQSLPATTAAEDAGEIPTDWEIAPAKAVESLKEGRLPHLTWGRVILGGLVSLSMLFGGAGLWVALTGGPGFLGPTAAGASDAAEGIAILPFNVSGIDDQDFWGEGMVDLLSTNLDGMGGYRTIDSRTVLARWRENVGDNTAPDLQTALRAAGQTGARYAIVGSAVGIGSDLRLVTEIYDLASSDEIGSGQVQGSEADPMRLIDDLSLETMRLLLAGGGEELATSRNLADLTTFSVPALRAYLEGERHYRRAEFPRAVEAYQRALDADSTFALALFRISDTYGWMESVSSPTAIALGARSVQFMDRLSARNAVIVAGGNALYTGDLTKVKELEAAVRHYPDDPEAWFMLAELYLHLGEATGQSAEVALATMMRAVELDPGFAPYYVHAIDRNLVLGNVDEARRLIERYASFSGTEELTPEHPITLDLFFGNDAEREAAWPALDGLSELRLNIMWGTYGFFMDDVVRSAEVAEHLRMRSGGDGWTVGIATFLTNTGEMRRAEAMLRDSISSEPGPAAIYTLHRFGVDMSDLLDGVRSCDPGTGGCGIWRGALAAEEGDWDRHAESVTVLQQAAERIRADGDSINARYAQSSADALIGYEAYLRGNLGRARSVLEGAQGKSNGSGDLFIRLTLGQTYEALGRPQEAIKWFGLLHESNLRSYALAQKARLQEEIGDDAAARATWRQVVSNYRNADEGYEPALTARAALERLGG